MARVETTAGYDHHDRHVHVHLTDERATYYDLVTEFLQAAGKAPDWYWRLVGAFGPHESDKLEEIISTAFEAGAFVSHDHPEDVDFEWVTEEECEEERREAEEEPVPGTNGGGSVSDGHPSNGHGLNGNGNGTGNGKGYPNGNGKHAASRNGGGSVA
jgi:hypothetical protein